MTEPEATRRLTRQEASDSVGATGWRYLLGTLTATLPVDSMNAAAEAAVTVTGVCGPFADEHLRLDLRPSRIGLSLQTRAISAVTQRDVELARAISDAVGGVSPGPAAGSGRPVEMLELAIDALDIAAVRPFWKAVMAYVEEPGREAEADSLVDPAGVLTTIWFQQMTEPREQRNRIHFDLTVAHDEAEARVAAAVAAGGTVIDDTHARAFWVIADPEGNEVCVCTWQDRDQRQPIGG